MAWIHVCKRCKFGEKICYSSRDIELFLRDYFFGAPCTSGPKSVITIVLSDIVSYSVEILAIWRFSWFLATFLLRVRRNSNFHSLRLQHNEFLT